MNLRPNSLRHAEAMMRRVNARIARHWLSVDRMPNARFLRILNRQQARLMRLEREAVEMERCLLEEALP